MNKRKVSPEDVLNTQSLVFTDVWIQAEKQRLLLRVLPWIGRVLAVSVLLLGVQAAFPPLTWQILMLMVVMLLGAAATHVALRQAQKDRLVRSSRIIVVVLLLVNLTLILTFENPIIAYSVVGLPIALLASILISVRAGYLVAAIFTLSGLSISLLQTYHVIPPAWSLTLVHQSLLNLSIYVLNTLMALTLIAMSQEGTHKALEQVITQANELKVTNKRLAHEIRERERAEEELARLNTSLEAEVKKRAAEIIAEKEKSEAILRSAGDAISVTDMDMNIQYVNEAFTRVTGYNPDDIIGKPMFTLLAANMQSHEPPSDTDAMRDEGRQGEILARRKDGRTYDAEMSFAPVNDDQGNPIGFVFSHQDITRLKDLDRARNRFIANVSHELRTPLTIMKLAVHTLKKEKGTPKAQGQLEVLEKQTAQLELLIQDILQMTVFDSGKAIVDWAPVPPNVIVDNAVIHCQEDIQKHHIVLTQSPPTLEHMPAVMGDHTRLTQALYEVLENAILFSPEGGEVKIAVEIREDEQRRWLTISVQDHGPGITNEEMPQLFERFFRGRLAESGHVPGTGLGLSITHEIINVHSGRITVESKVHQGSRFTLWLPLGAVDQGT